MSVRLPKNGGLAGACSRAIKWRIYRCVLACQKIEDPQMRVRPPENGGSPAARSPA